MSVDRRGEMVWLQEDSTTNPFKPTLIEFEPELRHRLDALWEKMVGTTK